MSRRPSTKVTVPFGLRARPCGDAGMPKSVFGTGSWVNAVWAASRKAILLLAVSDAHTRPWPSTTTPRGSDVLTSCAFTLATGLGRAKCWAMALWTGLAALGTTWISSLVPSATNQTGPSPARAMPAGPEQPQGRSASDRSWPAGDTCITPRALAPCSVNHRTVSPAEPAVATMLCGWRDCGAAFTGRGKPLKVAQVPAQAGSGIWVVAPVVRSIRAMALPSISVAQPVVPLMARSCGARPVLASVRAWNPPVKGKFVWASVVPSILAIVSEPSSGSQRFPLSSHAPADGEVKFWVAGDVGAR